MGTQYLIDTNAVIEFLAGELPDTGSSWLQNLLDSNAVHLSVINQIELLGFNGDMVILFILFVSKVKLSILINKTKQTSSITSLFNL